MLIATTIANLVVVAGLVLWCCMLLILLSDWMEQRKPRIRDKRDRFVA